MVVQSQTMDTITYQHMVDDFGCTFMAIDAKKDVAMAVEPILVLLFTGPYEAQKLFRGGLQRL